MLRWDDNPHGTAPLGIDDQESWEEIGARTKTDPPTLRWWAARRLADAADRRRARGLRLRHVAACAIVPILGLVLLAVWLVERHR
jgi:hypothetical protein